MPGYLGLDTPTRKGMHWNLSSGADTPKGNTEFCNFNKNTQKPAIKKKKKKVLGRILDCLIVGADYLVYTVGFNYLKKLQKLVPKNSFYPNRIEILCHSYWYSAANCRYWGLTFLQEMENLFEYSAYFPTWIMQWGFLVNKNSNSRTCSILHRNSPSQRVVPEAHRMVTTPVGN